MRSGCFENRAAHLRLARLFTRGKRGIYRAANDAGIRLFRVSDDTRFVDFFARDPDLSGCRWQIVLVGNDLRISRRMLGNLTAFLSRVVFIGKTALRQRLDFKCVGLRAVRSRDKVVMRALGPTEPRGLLGYVICD